MSDPLEKNLWKTTRHDAITCPTCGYNMNASTKIGDDGTGSGPGPGDFTVCGGCGEFLSYGEGLVLEKTEMPDDMGDEQKKRVLATQAFFRARKKNQ